MRLTPHPSRPKAGASLDDKTQLVHRDLDQLLRRRTGVWVASAWPDAAEAVVCLSPEPLADQIDPVDSRTPEGQERSQWADLDEAERQRRNWARANKRACAESRRYIVANRLRFQWVLTFAGDGLQGPEGRAQCMRLVALFVIRLRREFGEIAYWFSPELHPDGHGWHVNFLVPRRLPHDRMEALWGHGHVWVSDKTKHQEVRKRGLPFVEALRLAALYACKYAVKDWSPEQIPPGAHRFECAAGFKPRKVSQRFLTERSALEFVEGPFGEPPDWVWRSTECEDWEGPPAICLRWSRPAVGGGNE